MHPTVPWPLVGKLDPAGLVDTRLQAHHAVQLVVALGISCLPPEPDDSHTNLEWLPGRAFASRAIAGSSPIRAALRLDPLILMLLDESGDVLDEYRLAGRTVAQGWRWLKEALRAAGNASDQLTDRKHYAIPAHPVGGGHPFHPDSAACRELSGYYHGASLALGEVAAGRVNASEVRGWPHHFDLATLITLAPGKTIGAGLSPGDDSYAEPYYYVTPYPHPGAPPARLSSGVWHTTAWVGAVLPASHFCRLATSEAQQDMIRAFLGDAITVCESLL